MPEIDTRPDAPVPPEVLIAAAMRDIPRTMDEMENTTELYGRDPAPGQKIVVHHQLAPNGFSGGDGEL
jgi:hypothetical protein